MNFHIFFPFFSGSLKINISTLVQLRNFNTHHFHKIIVKYSINLQWIHNIVLNLLLKINKFIQLLHHIFLLFLFRIFFIHRMNSFNNLIHQLILTSKLFSFFQKPFLKISLIINNLLSFIFIITYPLFSFLFLYLLSMHKISFMLYNFT